MKLLKSLLKVCKRCALECFCHSGFRTSTLLIKVKILAAPYWVGNRMPANVNSSELSTVEFICNAQGRPTPMYTFYKNGSRKKFVFDIYCYFFNCIEDNSQFVIYQIGNTSSVLNNFSNALFSLLYSY